jgi:hypothetical protein
MKRPGVPVDLSSVEGVSFDGFTAETLRAQRIVDQDFILNKLSPNSVSLW